MKLALQEAESAYAMQEVPVGAVVVCEGRVIARTHNYTERLNDFTAHAEMQAYTSASEYLGGKYLNECTLYVTLEPCVMCMGAAYNTKIGRIVFGASDPKRGFERIAKQANDLSGFVHPKSKFTSGVLSEECASLLQQFFEERRSKK